MKRIVAAALLLGSIGLTACSGTGAVEGDAGPAEPAPRTSAAPAVSPNSESDSGSGVRVPADVPKEFCSFLKDEVPELKERGSGLASLARFAASYAGWLGEDANRALGTAAELDAITTTSCPKIRSQVLDALDRDSLAQVLGR